MQFQNVNSNLPKTMYLIHKIMTISRYFKLKLWHVKFEMSPNYNLIVCVVMKLLHPKILLECSGLLPGHSGQKSD